MDDGDQSGHFWRFLPFPFRQSAYRIRGSGCSLLHFTMIVPPNSFSMDSNHLFTRIHQRVAFVASLVDSSAL